MAELRRCRSRSIVTRPREARRRADFDRLLDVMDERPGAVRRAGAGAWHVLAGVGFLIRRPSLWRLAVLPALIAVVCLIGGVLLAVYSVDWIENAVLPAQTRLTTL